METSGSCNKKRKICHQEDEEDDEEKMEKFFALIRSIREARDHLMGGASNGVTEKERSNTSKKSKVGDDLHHHRQEEMLQPKPIAVWKPSFEREDFIGEADRLMMIKNPPVASTVASETKKGTEKEGVGDEDLDLNLSL